MKFIINRRLIMSKVTITLKKSVIGSKPGQVAHVKALAMQHRKLSVEQELTPQIKGMLHKVRHLVEVKEN